MRAFSSRNRTRRQELSPRVPIHAQSEANEFVEADQSHIAPQRSRSVENPSSTFFEIDTGDPLVRVSDNVSICAPAWTNYIPAVPHVGDLRANRAAEVTLAPVVWRSVKLKRKFARDKARARS